MSVPLEAPEEVAPTVKTFFAKAGDPTVQASLRVGTYSQPPSFPAANMIRFSGFWMFTTKLAEDAEGGALGRREIVHGVSTEAREWVKPRPTAALYIGYNSRCQPLAVVSDDMDVPM